MTSIKQIIHIYSNIVPNPKTLIASLCIGISFATAAGTYETQSDIMISGVDYTYESSPNSNGTPSFRGQLSFSISFSDSPDYIVIGKTKPHLIDKDRKFMSIKYMIDDLDGKQSIRYELDNIDWGTYVNATRYNSDGSYIISNMICSTDYLSESDKALVSASSASVEAPECKDPIIINGRKLTLAEHQEGRLSVFDMNGRHIVSAKIKSDTIFELPISSKGPIIVQLISNDYIIVKKIEVK